VLAVLEAQRNETLALLDDFSETRSLHRIRQGKWSARSHVSMSTTPSGILATLGEMQQPTKDMLQSCSRRTRRWSRPASSRSALNVFSSWRQRRTCG